MALLVLLLAPGWTAGCRTGAPSQYTARPGPYDLISEGGLLRLVQARRLMLRGDLAEAREGLYRLTGLFPNNVAVASALQDCELAILTRALRNDPELPADGDPVVLAREEMRRESRRLADERPSCLNLLLAARCEDDVPAALHLLERALEVDPECVWVHYARAHCMARSGDWQEALASLENAFALDPGHMPSRRLEAAALVRLSTRTEAISALRTWLEKAQEDPSLDPQVVADARMDLVLLLILERQNEEAKDLLLSIHPSMVDPARRLTALAAAEQGMGRLLEALRAAQEAERAEPGLALPLAQQAMLYEYWFEDPEAAADVWRQVIAQGGENPDLARLITNARARFALERLESGGTPMQDMATSEPFDPVPFEPKKVP